jgi:hypothetical protein
VRAYNGTASRWHKAAMQQKLGRITAAGVTKNVAFEPVDGPINDDVDEAYRESTRPAPISTNDQQAQPFRNSKDRTNRELKDGR